MLDWDRVLGNMPPQVAEMLRNRWVNRGGQWGQGVGAGVGAGMAADFRNRPELTLQPRPIGPGPVNGADALRQQMLPPLPMNAAIGMGQGQPQPGPLGFAPVTSNMTPFPAAAAAARLQGWRT